MFYSIGIGIGIGIGIAQGAQAYASPPTAATTYFFCKDMTLSVSRTFSTTTKWSDQFVFNFPCRYVIMAGMAVFCVAGYLIEERRRWPVITASPRGQCSK